MSSENRFNFEWSKYKELDPSYEKQFLGWVSPLKLEDFKNKVVLDAGCGMGRNSFWPLKYDAKKVIAFDNAEGTLESARQTLASYTNVEILKLSIYDIPWENEFDIVFSIGVIHHLKDPQLAINKLVQAVRPGGTVLIWVYGYEGNEWIVRLVSPVRKYFTSKLPPFILDKLTYFVSIPLYLFVKIFPVRNEYLKQLKTFNFKHIHSIVFDQLLPEIANYWKKEEVFSLMNKANLKNIQIRQHNGNSWTAWGIK
jgi:SAM-dependent methyltransferase